MTNHDNNNTGWWLSPTPLKNDGVRQLGLWHSQYIYKILTATVWDHQKLLFFHFFIFIFISIFIFIFIIIFIIVFFILSSFFSFLFITFCHQTSFFSFATSFFFICNFIFFHFPLCLMVFHCFSWLSWISGATGKENEKNMKNMQTKWKKWKFPRVCEDFLVRSENLQLWVQMFIFFHLQLHVFFIFLCVWWFFIVFHGFPGFQVPRARKMKKQWKKWKNMNISSSFWRFPGSEWESATLSPNFHFFFICNFMFFSFSFVFDGFPLFFIVFHGFPGFQVPRARKMKKKWNIMQKKWKNMKISSSFWRFPGSEWESATLSPNFHFFSFATSCFFHFPLFLMVFHCFSLFFMAFLDFRCHGQGKWKKNEKNENFLEFLKISWFGVRICNFESKFSCFFHLQLHVFFIFLCFWWFSIVFHCFSWFSWISGAAGKENEKKMKKMKTKWKNMKKNENFLEFLKISWFGVRICNFESKFSFFFICNFIFFSFSFVFDGFPLFFMAFLDFRCHGQGKWKKMKKTWKFPRVFEDFLVRSENLQLWGQIFIFFSFATSFFFHFPLFLMVFHCFSWLSWISGATGKENEKKMKKMNISSSFWRFPGSEWESATLSPNFHFFHLQLHFFFIFLCFWWFSIVFHGFPGFQVPRERKMKTQW